MRALFERLMARLVDEADRRVIETDLADLYEHRRRENGDRAAARWLARERRAYIRHLAADRLRAAVHDWRPTMPFLWRDLVYSLRSLARTPAVTAAIVLTVGVGLGATAGMIGVVRAVVVHPLPYPSAESLYWIYTDNAPFRFRFSVVDYRALEADHPAFSNVAGYQTNEVTVTDRDSAERVWTRSVTGSFFPLLGLKPRIGRLFDPSDDAHRDALAVLTHEYWTSHFAADRGVLGRTITLDGAPHTIVGVLEASSGPLEHNMAAFIAAHWPEPRRKGPFFTMALGRLRADVSREAALDTLRATNRRLFPIWKSSYQDEKATWGLLDFKARAIGDIGSTLAVVLAAVGCVLLLACANAVNLLIGRSLGRSRELAIRTALGASRGRLFQHLVVESAALTAMSAIAGAVVAALTLRLVTSYGEGYIPRIGEIRFSADVIAWLAALAAASGAIILAGGLVPALTGSRAQMDRALRASGRSSTDGPAARRVRRALVAAEFALATPLVVAAVLVLTSLDRLSRVPVGIDMHPVITAGISLYGQGYADEASRKAFWDRTMERLSALPGVNAVALADSRPPQEAGQTNNFDLEDHPTPPGQNQPLSTWVGVSPGFFRAVGLPLVKGRLLDDKSLQNDEVVVDRAWADRFFSGQDAIGRRMKNGGCTTCPWTTVVGIVGTIKFRGLEASDDGTVYFPFVDMPSAFVVLRASGDPASIVPSLRTAVRELDPKLALTDIATGEELVTTSLTEPRYLSVLIGMFGVTAVLLSIVGIYGVMAYFVQQHTRDLGIRLALGGDPAALRRMVVLLGLRLVGAGIAAGIGVALLTGRVMTSVLFDVQPTDLRTLLAVPAALAIIACLACLVPAARAARIDPAEILRES